MPVINISPKVRFVLYILGALALLTVSYAVDKSWAGDAEVQYVTGLAALLQLLAAAKTNTSDGGVMLEGKVQETGPGTADVVLGEPGELDKERPILGKAFTGGVFSQAEDPSARRREERGDHGVNVVAVAFVVGAVLLILALIGIR